MLDLPNFQSRRVRECELLIVAGVGVELVQGKPFHQHALLLVPVVLPRPAPAVVLVLLVSVVRVASGRAGRRGVGLARHAFVCDGFLLERPTRVARTFYAVSGAAGSLAGKPASGTTPTATAS